MTIRIKPRISGVIGQNLSIRNHNRPMTINVRTTEINDMLIGPDVLDSDTLSPDVDLIYVAEH